MQIYAFDSCFYNEVHAVVERRNGKVFKTKFKGFCHQSRPIQKDEVYTSLSTKLTATTQQIVLEPFLN